MSLFKPIIDDLTLRPEIEVDFLRYIPQSGNLVYFYPSSERAKTFCLSNHVMQALLVCNAALPQLTGWYVFGWDHRMNDNHAAKICKVDPPFTDADADPFA